jgi:hypothetical protein
MKVILYPERIWGTFGDTRYLLETEIVKPESMGKDEIDIDSDLMRKQWSFKTEDKARQFANASVLTRKDLAFGAVTLQKQVVDWFVQEDNVAEWSDMGESEELTR